MLQNIREKAQGWVAWIILGMIGVSFVFWGVGDYFSKDPGKQAAVEVNKDKITYRELDSLVERLQRQQAYQNPEIEFDLPAVKQAALRSLIDTKVLEQSVKTMGFWVNDNQVKRLISSLTYFQENGVFSKTKLQQLLNSLGYTEASFIKEIKANFLISQLEQGIVGSSFSLVPEVSRFVKYLEQKRDIRYVVFPLSLFNKDVKIAPEAIEAYYNQHKDDFLTEEKLSLDYLLLDKADFAHKVNYTEDELKQFYDKNLAQFTTPEKIHVAHILIALPEKATEEQIKAAKNKADDLLKKIKAGEDFKKLAQAYSDDTASGKAGGVLSPFMRGEMVAEFEKAAFELKKPEQLSELVRSPYGFHIIQLIEKVLPQKEPFEKVKAQLTQQYVQQKMETEFTEVSEDIATLAYEHPDSLAPIIEKYKLTVQTSPLISASDPKGIFKHPKVLKAAFAADITQDKHNSEIIQLDDNRYIVFRINQYEPAVQKSFASVEQEIKSYLISEQAHGLAEAKKSNLVTQMKTGLSLEKIAQEYRLPIKYFKNLQRKQAEQAKYLPNAQLGIDIAIAEAAFDIPSYMPDQDALLLVRSAALPNGDFAIVKIDKISETTETLPAEILAIYQKDFALAEGQAEFTVFKANATKKAKIKNHIEEKEKEKEKEQDKTEETP